MKNSIKINKGHLLLGAMLVLILFLETRNSYGFLQTVISVRGNIINQIDGEGLNTNIEVKDKDGTIVFRTKTFESSGGEYYITGLKPNNNYKVYIKSNGFENSKELIKTPNSEKFTEIEKNFKLKPLKK
jgi:hypothetical protein